MSEISKDIATARSKNGNFRRHHSYLTPPIQRTPTICLNIGITLASRGKNKAALSHGNRTMPL